MVLSWKRVSPDSIIDKSLLFLWCAPVLVFEHDIIIPPSLHFKAGLLPSVQHLRKNIPQAADQRTHGRHVQHL